MRRLLALTVVLAIVSVTSMPNAGSQEGQQAKSKPLPPATSAALRRLLSTRFDVPDVLREGPTPLKVHLKYLSDLAASRGERLDIVPNRQAFKDAAVDSAALLDENIEMPDHARTLTLQQYLTVLTTQLPTESRFRIREGILELTTADSIYPGKVLEQNVFVEFRNTPFETAIEELSDRTGLSIAIDPACEEASYRKTVTLRANNDMTLRAALETIADLCDLKLAATNERVLMTPRPAHLKRLREQLEELKLSLEIETAKPGLEPPPNPFLFTPGAGIKPGGRTKLP
jgi:hypothetical protein